MAMQDQGGQLKTFLDVLSLGKRWSGFMSIVLRTYGRTRKMHRLAFGFGYRYGAATWSGQLERPREVVLCRSLHRKHTNSHQTLAPGLLIVIWIMFLEIFRPDRLSKPSLGYIYSNPSILQVQDTHP